MRKEIINIAKSSRFQCEDEEFKFVYHKGEDLDVAMSHLGEIVQDVKGKVVDIKQNGENMTLKEFKENLRDATEGSLKRLKTWAKEQADNLKDHVDSLNLQRLDSTPIDHSKCAAVYE